MIVAPRPPASLVGCRRIDRAHPPNFRRLNTATWPSARWLHCPCSNDSLASSLTSTSSLISLAGSATRLLPVDKIVAGQVVHRQTACSLQLVARSSTNSRLLVVTIPIGRRYIHYGSQISR